VSIIVDVTYYPPFIWWWHSCHKSSYISMACATHCTHCDLSLT